MNETTKPKSEERTVPQDKIPDINWAVQQIFPRIIPIGDHDTLDEKEKLPYRSIRVFWVKTKQGNWLLMKRGINAQQVLILQNEKEKLTHLQSSPYINAQRLNVDYSGFPADYLLIEPIIGIDIADFVTELKAKGIVLTSQALITITREVVSQLYLAHKSGVIHLDIKPKNILLSPFPAEAELNKRIGSDNIPVCSAEEILAAIVAGQFKPYIIDYGIAAWTNAQTEGEWIGTEGFMHPWLETGKDIHIQPRFDIYSLIITLRYLASEANWQPSAKHAVDEVLKFLIQAEYLVCDPASELDSMAKFAIGIEAILRKHEEN